MPFSNKVIFVSHGGEVLQKCLNFISWIKIVDFHVIKILFSRLITSGSKGMPGSRPPGLKSKCFTILAFKWPLPARNKGHRKANICCISEWKCVYTRIIFPFVRIVKLVTEGGTSDYSCSPTDINLDVKEEIGWRLQLLPTCQWARPPWSGCRWGGHSSRRAWPPRRPTSRCSESQRGRRGLWSRRPRTLGRRSGWDKSKWLKCVRTTKLDQLLNFAHMNMMFGAFARTQGRGSRSRKTLWAMFNPQSRISW